MVIEGNGRDDASRAREVCDAFVGGRTGKKRPRRDGIAASKMRAEEEKAREAMRTGDWSEATASTFVALVCVLHERVYDVPLTLAPKERLFAARAAGQMLQREFGGDVGAMASFIRWTWQREKQREEWRRKNARDGGSVGWRLQFGGHVLTDYRLARARGQKR